MINILGYANVAVGTVNLVFGVTTGDITSLLIGVFNLLVGFWVLFGVDG